MLKKNNVLQITSVIISIVIGAGFATGQELMTFFIRFGRIGFAGILVSGAIIALTVWLSLSLCRKKHLCNYNEFMLFVFGKKLSLIIETSISLFLFVLFSTMLSAGGEIFRGAFGAPFYLGASLIAILCLITFATGMEGFVRINAILAPIMAIGTIIIGLFSIIFDSAPAFFQDSPLINVNWLMSATLYASYNMLTAISVLCPLSKLVSLKQAPFICGITAGGIITVLGICMSLPLFVNFRALFGLEIPLLKIARSHGKAIEYSYLLILFSAVFTTAVANSFAFIEWIKSSFQIDGMAVKIIITICALICAHAGFTNFVTVFYPLFGYIGIVELIFIFMRFIFSARN